jgi:hypothetical protein
MYSLLTPGRRQGQSQSLSGGLYFLKAVLGLRLSMTAKGSTLEHAVTQILGKLYFHQSFDRC